MCVDGEMVELWVGEGVVMEAWLVVRSEEFSRSFSSCICRISLAVIPSQEGRQFFLFIYSATQLLIPEIPNKNHV